MFQTFRLKPHWQISQTFPIVVGAGYSHLQHHLVAKKLFIRLYPIGGSDSDKLQHLELGDRVRVHSRRYMCVAAGTHSNRRTDNDTSAQV